MQSLVLVVDDEVTLAGSIAARLRAEGHRVEVVHDGPAAVQACRQLRPDAVVLDVMLPGLDGLEVCRRIQAERPVPVLMLTARDDETDLLVGLGVGADDYLTKPFSQRELVARVAALLRRVRRAAELTDPAEPDAARAVVPDKAASGPQPERLLLGDVVVDRAEHRVWRGEQEVHLTPREWDLLLQLAERPRAVRSRAQLLAAVWGIDVADASAARTVDSHIRGLRAKLGADAVRTVPGTGYALALAPTRDAP